MKKIFLAVATVAVVAAAGWGYRQSKQTPKLSELALANIEALADNESGSSIVGDCYGSVVIVTECKVVCICGAEWYPTPRVPKANAANVSGSCGKCGNSHWGAYN